MMCAIWEDVKDQLRAELPEASFSLWIDPITFIDDKNDTLMLGCPNRFSRNWIIENYLGMLEEKIDKTGNGNYTLTLKVTAPQKSSPSPPNLENSDQLILPNMPRKTHMGRKWLNSEFTFDRFVVGNCNEFAYSASKDMALRGNCPYDSLYIMASTGLGKSHLSQAIGHAILDHDPQLRLCYTTAENFIYELVWAIKNNKIDEFKDRYRRSCDVLVLEEVHFLSGKEKIQFELGYTLDVLVNDHKKVVFTSSFLPKDIPNLKKELSSRFASGIITNLDKPDYKTRVKIFEQKSSELNLPLPEEVINLFAKYLTRDVRQMEGALKSLKAKSDLMREKITPDLAREILKCHASEEGSITMEDVKKLVCQYFRVDPLILPSKSRKKIHAYPRNIYVYLCRHYTDETLENIGKSIERKHSTVIYASEVIEQKIKVDHKVKKQVNFLVEKLKNVTH